MSTLITSVTYHPETCCNCGIPFAMSMEFYQERRTNGGLFHCPNGHAQHYTKPKVKFLEEQIEAKNRELAETEQARQRLIEANASALAEAEHFRKSRDITRGLLNKVKRRARSGVCPCCSRTFKQLAAHMEAKHPDFGPEKTPSK